ncbi:hypothetical protein ACTMUQ_40565 [Streptomyces sp. SD11]|uniref:hypothetical protein n=1 Tax=Streptomyces sp. SD11 TaxID=3452209 RepID=UPI003F898086
MEHDLGRPCLEIADRDGFGQAASAVQEVGHLVRADLPLRMDKLREAVAVDGDALFGESEIVVHRQERGEHAGPLGFGMGGEISER